MNKQLITMALTHALALFIGGLLMFLIFFKQDTSQVGNSELLAQLQQDNDQQQLTINALNMQIVNLQQSLDAVALSTPQSQIQQLVQQPMQQSAQQLAQDNPRIVEQERTDALVTNSVSTPPNEYEQYKIKTQYALTQLNQQTVASALPAKVQHDFSTQTVDTDWANASESNIRYRLESINTETAYSLDNVECRSSQCRVTISATDANQSHEISQLLAGKLQDKGLFDAKTAVISQQQPGSQVVELYIMDGENLSDMLIGNSMK